MVLPLRKLRPQGAPASIALAALLCALPACDHKDKPAEAPAPAAPQGPPPPAKVLEHEPNDAQHAQGIPDRAIVAGSIDPQKKGTADDDWYRVTPGPGVTLALRVELESAPPVASAAPNAKTDAGVLDAWLEIYDRDRNKLLRQHVGKDEPGLLPSVGCTEACFVRVSGTSPASYRLTVEGKQPQANEEVEPNNRAIDATALTPGKQAVGTYLSGDDEDWFKVVVPDVKPGQFLKVDLSAVQGVRPELEIRALSDGALLASVKAANASEGVFVRDLALQLDAPAQTPTPTPTPTPPPAAPTGDAPAPQAPSATSTAAATSPAALAAPSPDAATSTPAPAAEAASSSTPSAAAPSAAPLAAAASSTAAPSAAAAAPAPSAPAGAPAAAPTPAPAAAAPPAPQAAPPAAPAAAGYYLVVKSGWIAVAKGEKPRRGADPKTPYLLSVTVENGPPDLEIEPNDDPSRATPITATREGWLAPGGDADWYVVKSDKPQLLRVELSALERADTELSVWAPPTKPGDKPTQLARANEGGVREGELIPSVGIPAGDTLIKVESAQRNLDGKWTRDGEDRDNLYKLTIALAPDDGTHDKEPNDDADHAQTFTLQPKGTPTALSGTLWPKKDQDLFRFHLDEARPLSFRLGAVRGVDTMLTLSEAKGDAKVKLTTIGTADAAHGEGEEQILSVPLKPGDYVVSVSSPKGKDASATSGYTLTIQ